ncbi:alkaline phosphatase family protein [Leucobacter sp. UCMA 4100]|uniref:alkaline phosphatase family protein n=1 Tax=Leucobacter sp. UCMA 4100 TaxID=2810534 RepID=UPI0022EAFA72|nr:nucleotide pyrophosphatase/phosphodiesterase family protein [Leucobacter sp. UCMA 4100]
MLQTPTENGARLAAIMPTALSLLEAEPGVGEGSAIDCVIVIVADGLGWHNLRANAGYARTLSKLTSERVSTVFPSTTGAALTAITTGTLPGQHGLVGYRIMHPELGLRTTLTEWQGIEQVRDWQLQPTVFERASEAGVAAHVIGRAAHETGGLTSAILTGAAYVAEDAMEARFDRAIELAFGEGSRLVYLYVDELDRAGHERGAASDAWVEQLERLDSQVAGLLRRVPGNTGILMTADHGMVDVNAEAHIEITAGDEVLEGVSAVGGEPRLRYWYLEDDARAEEIAERARSFFGERASVATRQEAVHAGWFGRVAPEVEQRIGDVVIAALGETAIYGAEDSPASRRMVGQHGSISEIERDVPLLMAGAIPSEAFLEAIERNARSIGAVRKPRKKRH